MRRMVLITTLAFIAGLFAAGQGLGAGEYGTEKRSKEDRAMMGESQRMAGQLNQDQVSELQRILKEKGHDPGPVDGIMGPRTQGAIRDFQREEDLAVTGQPDAETLRNLAPDSEMQEFFGLSPEFGEQEMEERHEFEEKEMEERHESEKMGTPERESSEW